MQRLKFITCGSVDDGKSTLIGHLLYGAKLLFADQERALELDSRLGQRDGALDYSLLLDGLMAEREQKITIDVAYRYFTTEKRSFIVADCPGHEQYTRNMAVGASFAELAVILVDVANGVISQTLRHTRICSLMGIQHFVLAVNKMDLVDFDFYRFKEIENAFKGYMAQFPVQSLQVIPLSATGGDNILYLSERMGWYKGPALLPYLENVDVSAERGEDTGFFMPVQRVSRPNHTFRGFQGQVFAGRACVGDEVAVRPSGEKAHIKRLLVGDREMESAGEGQPVTLLLDREIDASRGDVITGALPVEQTSLFSANLLWMDDSPLIPGRGYWLKCATKQLPAEIIKLKHRVEPETGKRLKAEKLYKNEIAECDISLIEPIVLTPFEQQQALGSFILIDRITNMTSACGVVLHSLRRAQNVVWQDTVVTRESRAQQKGQTPMTIWLTGLSGAGKSALANELERRLAALGKHTMLLDGDNLRHGLNANLGFTEQDRVENVRRTAEVAKLLNDAGIIVITALISPYKEDRARAKDSIGHESFMEVYVSTPLETCERRDVKGLYKKAREGGIPAFTGISSPYEPPEQPDIAIDMSIGSISGAADTVLDVLKARLGG